MQFQDLESLSYTAVPQNVEPWDVQDVTGIWKIWEEVKMQKGCPMRMINWLGGLFFFFTNVSFFYIL